MNLTRRSSRPLPGLITERLALQPATANDPQPIYQYIVEDIEARIKRGELRAGAQLVSERTLADHYGVSYQTQRRAMRALRERGLIHTIQGRGTFIA